MRFSFIEEHKDCWPVVVMADLLGVSTAGFYAWRDRPASDRQQRRDALLVEIAAIHERVKGRYGSPRVHAELKADGHGCCVNTVAEVMRQAGITYGSLVFEGGFGNPRATWSYKLVGSPQRSRRRSCTWVKGDRST